jgi:hypothetical protein
MPATTPGAGRGTRDLELREALRVSREAIVAIRNELDALLRSVQATNAARGSGPAGAAAARVEARVEARAEAIDRLARSTRRADAAVRGLSTSSS